MLASIVLAALVANAPAADARVVQQPPAPAAQTAPESPWPPAGVSRPGRGVVLPRLVKEVKPDYTLEAKRERIQGTVLLEAVVRRDGTVGEVRVKRSLDPQFGLDQQAVNALKKWQFAPGTKDGVAVPVLVEIEMRFTLK